MIRSDLNSTDWSDFNRDGQELYNHSASPVPTSYDMETVNIAKEPGALEVVKKLHAQVKAFNTRGL